MYELPFGKDKKWGTNWSPMTNAFLGGWQFNATQTFQSGTPFDVSYAGAGSDRDVGPNRPNVNGDIEIFGGRDKYFDTTPIGASGSPYSRPAVGTFGNMERNSLRGPGYRRTDASIFKHVRVGGTRDLEFRIEAVNLFNNVNLGNPEPRSARRGTTGRTPAASTPRRTATPTRSGTSSSRSSSSSEARRERARPAPSSPCRIRSAELEFGINSEFGVRNPDLLRNGGRVRVESRHATQ